MSRKMLVLCLVPFAVMAFVGCGGSPDASRDYRSATVASAAPQHAPDPGEDQPHDEPDEVATTSGDPHADGPVPPDESFTHHSPQPTPPPTDLAFPANSSKFDPQRFELPTSTEPAPPDSTPPDATPTDSTQAQPTASDSPSEFPNPEPASQNPLRRAIVRPSATGANDLRSFQGFIDPKTAFAAPPRATEPADSRLGNSVRTPEPRIRPYSSGPDASNTSATEAAPSATEPSAAEVAPADTVPSDPVFNPSGGAVRPDDIASYWPPESSAPESRAPQDSPPPAPAMLPAASVAPSSSRPLVESAPPNQSILPLVGQPADASAGPPEDVGSAPEPAKSVHEAVSADDPNSPFTTVKVFYATDRAAEDATSAARGETNRVRTRIWAMALCAVALVGAGVCLRRGRRTAGGLLAMSAVSVAIFVWVRTADSRPPLAPESDSARVAYRNERGNLEMGLCEVTIPKIHKEGRVERPQVWRLEFQERSDKHMILKSVERRAPDVFFDQVRDRVKQSSAEDLFVFVHGYNVSFETAALRTAQMAKDLEFQGAPIFYSWPSQGGLLRYTVDENNVTWTVPHLKQFLRELAEKSEAKAIHLIAHSMGNRALTAALREMAFESRGDGLHFQQIVLAAPDIDAEVFRRDIAPVLSRSADRVTLYASSNDQALAASKLVHGYPRAGDSGRDLVVLPGIETIDVSAADTSLLGHSYYGSSEPILHDLKLLIGRSQSAAVRPWLEPSVHDGHRYWIFDIRSAALGGQSTRR